MDHGVLNRHHPYDGCLSPRQGRRRVVVRDSLERTSFEPPIVEKRWETTLIVLGRLLDDIPWGYPHLDTPPHRPPLREDPRCSSPPRSRWARRRFAACWPRKKHRGERRHDDGDGEKLEGRDGEVLARPRDDLKQNPACLEKGDALGKVVRLAPIPYAIACNSWKLDALFEHR